MRHLIIVALGLTSLLPTRAAAQNVRFEADSAYTYLEHLCVKIGPRPMGSANERAALQWTVEQFRRFGADTVYVMPVPEANGTVNTNSGVAIGIMHGSTDSTIVIGGHIDSSGREIPGANDDGSGTACMIESARIWSQRPRRFTLLFAAFGGEESGLVGSEYFVDHYAALDKVKLMLQIDMAGSTESLIPFLEASSTHQAPAWLVEDAYAIDRVLGYNSLDYPTHFFSVNFAFPGGGAGSDHEPFLEKNIPAIDFTAGVNTSPIHTQRDAMELIPKPMLARSGLLVDGLLTKYQERGIPAPKKGNYMLWEAFGGRLYIPYWFLVATDVLALLLGGLAFFRSRRMRLQIEKSQRVKFSGFKLFFIMLLIAISVQLGEALMQFIKGLRYPWLVPLSHYLWFAVLWAVAGVWLGSQFTRFWRFSPDPYVYAKRAAIFLFILTILLGLSSARLALYPALSLIALSLAVFVPNAWLKLGATVVAFIPMWRLMFFEMFSLGARSLTGAGLGINSFLEAFLFSAVLTILMLFWFLPILYLVGYAFASAHSILNLLKPFRSLAAGFVILLAIVGYGGYLYALPAYDETWRAALHVNAEYELPKGESKLHLIGNEYFRRVDLTADTLQRHYDERIHEDEIPLRFEADWLKFSGVDSLAPGERDTVFANWQIVSSRPWFQVSLKLQVDTLEIQDIQTRLKYKHNSSDLTFSWYAEPPETLQVAARFTISKGAKVIRKIEAQYPEMPVPVRVTAALADVVYRTKVTYQDTLEFPAKPPASGAVY
ncbi:M28 family metallopeptidase [candidate division KSB1 bacterium]|nr:M28 family metallopeptidase [candidate division KSB1 bacterium]